MRKWLITSVLMMSIPLLFIGCKTEYEKVRQSNDPQLMKQKADEYFDEEEYDRAQILYELAISAFRGQKEAEDLFFKYAQTHYHQKQYILSAHYYKNFANTFINSDKREEAEYMAAYSNYKNSPSFRLDQKYTQDAIEGLQLFVNTYPHSERVSECNTLIDELRDKLEKKMYAEGQLYFDLEDYQSANQSFNNLLKDFPDSENAEEVRYKIVLSSFNLAENSIYEKRKERYEETLENVEQFNKRYKKSTYLKDVRQLERQARTAIKSLKND
jgi:outer membrane protein assembly factor BamD